MSSFDIVVKDLQNLGLKKGDTVVVHSSLKSMGHVEGGADTVIDALIEVVGKDGNVMFPALSWTPCCSTLKFDINETPSCIGYISNVFRKRDGVVRSFHPTHSVCAFGKNALELTKDHRLDDTPVGANSPYRKMLNYNGKILMLGCGTEPNTFMHGVEEIGGAPYVLGEPKTFEMTDVDGSITHKSIKQHYFHRPEGNIIQRYDRAVDVLEKGVDYSVGEVHGATAYLMNAKTLCEKAVAKMKVSPCYFIDDPNGIIKLD